MAPTRLPVIGCCFKIRTWRLALTEAWQFQHRLLGIGDGNVWIWWW